MGDGIQAAKAGILEIGDVFVVNKADRDGADATVRDLRHMISLGDRTEPGLWRPPVVKTVAAQKVGIDEVMEALDKHRAFIEENGELVRRRERRAADEIEAIALASLRARFGHLGGHEGSVAWPATSSPGTHRPVCRRRPSRGGARTSLTAQRPRRTGGERRGRRRENRWRRGRPRCHRRGMDIIPLDHDDDVMLKELFGVATRSESVSRVQPIQRTEDEFLKMVRFSFPGEREESAVAVVDGSPVGWARVFFPERDNLDKCWSHLEVDPQHRRQGVGSALARVDGAAGPRRRAATCC